ncbi:MAG: hypothetical protein NC310_00635 [Roseburia sp.]|nr:hypothetical protein [Anaeroplasma bactoclasticum]MCM1195558.1 hypothetical protein [Roseburia sp.]MCM1555973.1 hypothetical protein [Anaeroplasma bactoclasticum]
MKIWKNNYFILTIILIINIVVLICICVFTVQQVDVGESYELPPTQYTENPALAYRYKIETIEYQEELAFPAQLIVQETAFTEISIDECYLKPGEQFVAGAYLGIYKENKVLSAFDGICLENDSKKNSILVYYYNNFNLKITLSVEEYYDVVETQMDDFVMLYDKNEYSLTFKNFDYSDVKTQKKVYASFSPNDCKKIVTEEDGITIKQNIGSPKHFFCIPSVAFEQVHQTKLFYIINSSNEVQNIYITCVLIDKDKAIIECDLWNLEEGLYLYAGN